MYPAPVDSAELNVDHHNEIRRNYGAMIENIDRQAGRFIQAVEARGELDNTLIVYSSDHGEMLGDHDRWGKSVPYQPSAGVPLVIAGPRVASGVVTDTLVEIQDLRRRISRLGERRCSKVRMRSHCGQCWRVRKTRTGT